MKKYRSYIIFLACMMGFVLFILIMAPKPMNWSDSFSRIDTIPYGTYILYEKIRVLFPGKAITEIKKSLYDIKDLELFRNTNYLLINNKIELNDYETEKLLEFVSKGNTAFISVMSFDGALGKKLKIKTDYNIIFNEKEFTREKIIVKKEYKKIIKRKSTLNFVNRRLKKPGGYIYSDLSQSLVMGVYFSSFNKKGARILGINENGKPNFIKLPHGNGHFILSSVPYAFGNYNMLKDSNWNYAFRALSYLPDQNTLWDEYYKASRVMIRSPLRYILNQESLTWAYYCGIGTLFLFIIFHARRRQRIIPVIKPLENTSLEFVKLVGRLYFLRKDNKNLAHKMITYFFDHIRTWYNIDSYHYSSEMIEHFSQKTNIPRDKIEKLFKVIDVIQKSDKVSDEELIVLNKMFDEFLIDTNFTE